jgi:hypothetical protein
LVIDLGGGVVAAIEYLPGVVAAGP